MSEETAQFTYPAPETAWQQFEFSSTFLTALTLALLTTLISYQLTALIADLALGWKPRRVAPIHTFQTLLLSRKASPIAVLNALFRTDLLTRFYFQGNLPARSSITRDRARIKPNAVFLLLILLFTAPLVNILAVIMTIEQDEFVSFSAAGFRPVSFGIWNESSEQVRQERFSEVCSAIPMQYHPQDTRLARFLVCTQTLGPVRLISRPELGEEEVTKRGSISVLMNRNVSLKLQVRIGTSFIEGHVVGLLRTEGKNFVVRMNTSREDAEGLAERGMSMILDACGNNMEVDDVNRTTVGIDVPEGEEFIIGLGGNVPCNLPDGVDADVESMFRVMRTVTEEYVTLRDAEGMDIAPSRRVVNDVDAFEDGMGEIFVVRRTRLVGIPVMAILAGLSVIARLVVAMMFNNDVNDGIERLVKERVGMPYCGSLLQDEGTVVSYNARNDENGGPGLNPMRSYGAGSSFLPQISQRTPGTSQRTLVMFDGGVTYGNTSIDHIDYQNSRDPDPDPDPV